MLKKRVEDSTVGRKVQNLDPLCHFGGRIVKDLSIVTCYRPFTCTSNKRVLILETLTLKIGVPSRSTEVSNKIKITPIRECYR